MSVPPVFEGMDRFGFVHHRALNNAEALQHAIEQSRSRSDVTHVFEGDLCWNFENGRQDLYFRHPKFLTDVMPPHNLDRVRESGELLTLEGVLSQLGPDCRCIIELKFGVGDLTTAMATMLDILQNTLKDRYWLDAFSLKLLTAVKKIEPLAPTSLHTKCVLGNYVLRSALEFFPLSVHRISKLDQVDAITLTYLTSVANCFRWCGATIDGSLSSIATANKTLILGGLTTPRKFQLASNSMAKAGYGKFPLAKLPENEDH